MLDSKDTEVSTMRSNKTIKIFGERNTGTNFLEKLCEKNLAASVIKNNIPHPWSYVAVLLTHSKSKIANYPVSDLFRDAYFKKKFEKEYGWKHRSLLIDTEKRLLEKNPNLVYLICLRHPYPWLLSMYRKPYNLGIDTKKITLSEFIQARCNVARREFCNEKSFNNPLQLWSHKIRSYAECINLENVHVVRHEDLVENPRNVVQLFSTKFVIEQNQNFNNLTTSVKKDSRSQDEIRKSIKEFDPNKHFSKDDLAFIDSQVDEFCLKFSGYELAKF